MFGGNASSETRMHISGASCHWGKKNATETGILMELQLENKYLNDNFNSNHAGVRNRAGIGKSFYRHAHTSAKINSIFSFLN